MPSNFVVMEVAQDSSIEAYQPFGGAAELWLCKKSEVILSGPAETGKTRGAMEKLNLLLWKYPGAQAAMIRKRYADMPGSCIQTWEKKVLGSSLRTDNNPTGPITKYGGEKPQFYDYPHGSRLWIGGLDNPGKTLSSERDFIYPNQAEELELNDWETITTRATGRAGNAPYSQVFGDCNPTHPKHWILERSKAGALTLIESRHEDNPTLYQNGQLTEQGQRTMAVLDALTGLRKERLRFGRWVMAEGVVYENFSTTTHVITPFDIPASWPRMIAVDFGYRNPFCCQWWAMSPDGDFYMYREIYRTGYLVEDNAKLIKQVTTPEERVVFGVADHDAEDAATLARYGVRTQPAYKSIKPGIEQVQSMLAQDSRGLPQIRFFRQTLCHNPDEALVSQKKPVCTIDEIPNYIWPKGQDGKPVKEVPVDVDNHGCDTKRYLFATLYLDEPQVSKLVYNPVRIGTY